MPGLSEEDVDPDPISQFLSWYGYAPGDAVALVTASPRGLPSGRMVLLKGVDKSGFVFFTNYGSPKARDLAANPRAALLFFWPPDRQVRVSGWVALPDPIQLSADGALLFDSAGGEPLAIRLTAATRAKDTDPVDWRHFTLYRRVPASGVMNVTVALTGIGRAAFDDIRIEPLIAPR